MVLDQAPEATDATTDSSPVIDVQADPSPVADNGATAASPPPEDAKQSVPTLADVVRDAVQPTTAPEAPSAPETVTSEPDATAEAAPKGEAKDDAEPGGLHKHPRFQEVLSQRNAFKEEAEKLKAPAESYVKITAFLDDNGITNEEMVGLFKVAALAKVNPDEALKELQPLLTDLYERTGAFLPADLRDDVEEGRITEDRARELARTRAEAAESRRQVETTRERAARVEQETQAGTQAAAFERAVVDWEASVKARDPDFAVKEEFVADRCRALIAERGQPRTVEAMREILEQAHTDVTTALRKMAPQRGPVNPTPTTARTTDATAVPTSLEEAVRIAVARGK